jgi:hypothetical protein
VKVENVTFWGGEVSGSRESQRLAQFGSAPSLFEGLKALGLEERTSGAKAPRMLNNYGPTKQAAEKTRVPNSVPQGRLNLAHDDSLGWI